MPVYKIKIGDKVTSINVFEPGGWQFVTSQTVDFTFGLGKVGVGGGCGGFTMHVSQGPHKREQKGKSYRLWYYGLEASIGLGVPGLPSVAISTEDMPCGPFGQVFRMPGSPNASGEGGPPTGFLGTFTIISGSGGFGPGRSIALMLLGGIDMPVTSQTLSYKYATSVWGSFYGTPGIGVSALKGVVNRIEPLKKS